MRNLNFTLWLLTLVGLMTSCSQDEAAGTQQMESDMVRIGASINPQTRADTPIEIPKWCQLRYVLEVWTDSASSKRVLRYEQVQTGQSKPMKFSFQLAYAGNYKALLWADFIRSNATEEPQTTPNEYLKYQDWYYDTNTEEGLKKVTVQPVDINTPADHDAFYACMDIKKEAGALEKGVELKRPFGRIIIVEKNEEQFNKLDRAFATYSVPAHFNVMTDEVSGEIKKAKAKADRERLSLSSGTKLSIFSDYIFAPATGQTTLQEIAMTFRAHMDYKDAIVLNPFTIPANMPVVRNKRTIISGSILHDSPKPSDAAKLSVTISNGWEETSEEEDVDLIVWNGVRPDADASYQYGTDATGNYGDGSEEKPYLINSVTDFVQMAVNLDGDVNNSRHKCFRLTTDIDLAGHEWTPIEYFFGTFDGGGHTISGLSITRECGAGSHKCGLFGTVSATIKNLSIQGGINLTSTGERTVYIYVGGIAGIANSGNITDCQSWCKVTVADSNGFARVGGIAGDGLANCTNVAYKGSVDDLTVSGIGENYVGGIYGIVRAGNLSLLLSDVTVPDGMNIIGWCTMGENGSITVNGDPATSYQPYPVPAIP